VYVTVEGVGAAAAAAAAAPVTGTDSACPAEGAADEPVEAVTALNPRPCACERIGAVAARPPLDDCAAAGTILGSPAGDAHAPPPTLKAAAPVPPLRSACPIKFPTDPARTGAAAAEPTFGCVGAMPTGGFGPIIPGC
jgi:hypothetical protein